MLYGDEVIDTDILGIRTGRETVGHRFHSKKKLSITKPSSYLSRLEKAVYMLLPTLSGVKILIREQADAIVEEAFGDKAHALISEELLDEVTGLVEWPVVILGDFDQRFLDVPRRGVNFRDARSTALFSAVVDKHGILHAALCRSQ